MQNICHRKLAEAALRAPPKVAFVKRSGKKQIFKSFFLLFTARVRSQPPGPPAVPGVLSFLQKRNRNTPGTRGGPGGRDQTLAVKRRKTPEDQLFFVKNFQPREFPRSGSKAKDG